MGYLDLNLAENLFENATSARQVAAIGNELENIRAYEKAAMEVQAQHSAKMVAGAEASVAQKELMEKQLGELRSQNNILSEQLKAEQAQRELLEEHLEVTMKQNELLSANYQKLEEMYDAQKESYDDTRKDLHKSRVFNAWMMVIAIVSMLAAIAGPIVTILVSG